jgi:transposase-like protein
VEITTDRAPVYPRVIAALAPAARHLNERYANISVEADHGRFKARHAHVSLSPGPGEPSRLRQMRLAALLSQAPGDSMASCWCRVMAYQRA